MRLSTRSTRLLFSLVWLAACACSQSYSGKVPPQASGGVLDLREWNFQKDGPVQLSGQWNFFWQKFADDIRPKDRPATIEPGAWNTFLSGGKPIGSGGFGTYRLRVLLPPKPSKLTLKTGGYDSAARLRVAGTEHLIGIPGRTRELTHPVYRQDIVALDPSNAELEISVEVANFFHARGGMLSAPILDTGGRLEATRQRQQTLEAMLAAIFLVFGVYHLLLHVVRSNSAALYFGLYCIFFCLRTLQTGEENIHIFLPDLDLRIDLFMEYLGLFTFTPCFAMFLRALFPNEFPPWLQRIFLIVSTLYGCTLFMPSEQYSRLLIGYQAVILSVVLTAIVTAVRAWRHGRPSALLFLMGFASLGIGIVLDVSINILASISTPFSSLGMIGFIFAQAMVIAGRFARALRTSEELTANLKVAYADALDLREQLAQKQKMATVGDMAAGIVHDLKNPVAVIKGYAEMTGDDSISAAQRQRYLGFINQESDRVLDMVQDLLDFSRGSVSIKPRITEVSAFMERCLQAIGPTFEHKGVQVELDAAYRGPLRMDADKLLRVFANIAGNAADVLRSGGIFRISVDARKEAGRSFVVFELSDNGPGIPEEIQDRLFEPFVTHGKSHGTGLGMAITRSLVEAHGGDISFVSRIDQGTTFRIRLPGPDDNTVLVSGR